jgi:lambda family phage minor tail protein L
LSLNTDLYSLTPPALIDLFELDLNPLGTAQVFRFCNYEQSSGVDVVFGGQTYTAIPFESSGWELTGGGQLPRPTITVGNIYLVASGLVNTYSDLIGAKVSRLRTLSTYLDNGSSPDPTAVIGPEVYYVERKVSEDSLRCTWELSCPFDLEGLTLPSRRLLRNTCPWVFRSEECGYAGVQYATCGKTLTDCQQRFPAPQAVRFGGFPGLVEARG